MSKKPHTHNRLEDLKKENPFRVPEGYFDSLPGRISEAVSGEQSGAEAPRGFFSLLRPQLALAAGFLILVVAGYVAVQLILKPGNGNGNNYQNIAEYVEFNLDDFDESEIMEMVGGNPTEKESFADLDEEIIEYLVNENIDENTILEQLN